MIFFQEPDLGVGAPGEEGCYVPPTKGTSQTRVVITMRVRLLPSNVSIQLQLFLYPWNFMYRIAGNFRGIRLSRIGKR